MFKFTPSSHERTRAAQRMRKLKQKHHVRRVNADLVAVTSGRTGTEYLVDITRGSCSCIANLEFHKFCDHLHAAELFWDGYRQMVAQASHGSSEVGRANGLAAGQVG